MNLLIDRPPETVFIGGTEYEINSDFRASILFELLMQDDDVDDVRKLERALELYFPDGCPEEDLTEVFKAIIWFYRCGRSDKERKPGKPKKTAGDDTEEPEQEPEEEQGSGQRAYSFDYDDEYIYAAFRQQYGINLSEVEYLHWWEFRAMFKGLDHNCEFAKIMGYRTARITKEMSKTEKAFLHKMKSVHALPISEKEQQEADALVDALMNGGDLDKLLGYEEVGHG